MKKFIKGSLITAGVFFAIGFIMLAICLAAGGGRAAGTLRSDIFPGRIGKQAAAAIDSFFNGVDNLDSHNDPFFQTLTVNEKTYSAGETVEDKIDPAAVQNLDLDLSMGYLQVQKKDTEDGQIHISMTGGGKCSYYEKDGTLYIEGFARDENRSWFGNGGEGGNEITVEIPSGFTFQKIHAVIGAGEMTLSDMEASEFEGEIGAGRMQIDQMQVQDAKLEIGMGDCSFEGAISGELDATCDMGNLDFILEGEETDHNYEIDCAMGNIDIGSDSFSAFSTERTLDHQAADTYRLTCNMGNISMYFK